MARDLLSHLFGYLFQPCISRSSAGRPRRRRCLQALLKGCRALLSVEVADGFSERSCSERWKASSSWLSHASTGCEALPSVCCAMSPDSKTVGQMLLLKGCRSEYSGSIPIAKSLSRTRDCGVWPLKHTAINEALSTQNETTGTKLQHQMPKPYAEQKREVLDANGPSADAQETSCAFSSCLPQATAQVSFPVARVPLRCRHRKVRDATWPSLRLHWPSQRRGQVERGLDGAPRQALGVLASTTKSFFSHLPWGPRARGRRRREPSVNGNRCRTCCHGAWARGVRSAPSWTGAARRSR